MVNNDKVLKFIDELLEEQAADKTSIELEFSGQIEASMQHIVKQIHKKRIAARKLLGISTDIEMWTYIDYKWSFQTD